MQPFIRAASMECGFIKKSFLAPGKKLKSDNALRRSLAQQRDLENTRHHPYTSRAQKWQSTAHKTVSGLLCNIPIFQDKDMDKDTDDEEVIFRAPEWIHPSSIN